MDLLYIDAMSLNSFPFAVGAVSEIVAGVLETASA